MKKLKLDISQLRVDSFDAAASGSSNGGTVRGQTMYTCETGIGYYCTEDGRICDNTPTNDQCLTANCTPPTDPCYTAPDQACTIPGSPCQE